jgi:YesN/AraC family two-component response regulator
MKGLKILYVEDDEITRMILFRQLKEEFAEVYQAENGFEGLQLYKQHSPDIVITDLTMPVMSGVEMIREIQHISPKQTVIVLTGFHEQSKFLNNCLILKKPISAAEVFKLIEGIAAS